MEQPHIINYTKKLHRSAENSIFSRVFTATNKKKACYSLLAKTDALSDLLEVSAAFVASKRAAYHNRVF